MTAFKKAWLFLKALPEQQQYQPLPGLKEGFGEVTPSRRIGTVHPAIRGLMSRMQHPSTVDDSWAGEIPNPREGQEPNLSTSGTFDERGNRRRSPHGFLDPFYGRGGPEHEVYGDDTGISPQFHTGGGPFISDYSRIDNEDPVAGRPQPGGTEKPPKGSQQAMIDSLYDRAPARANQMFRNEPNE